MSVDKKNTEEEVDLGSLFAIIGRGFSNFFNFIGKVFKGLFHLLILLLLFTKAHLVKFVIAAVIGGSVGFFLEKNKEDIYSSDLIIQPNFGSTIELYSNTNYYNELVIQENIGELARLFNISEEEASSLKAFKVEPLENPSDIVMSYNVLVLAIDTLSIKNYPFEDFKKGFDITDYRSHILHVDASDAKVFTKLKNTIINSISKNKYFSRFKELKNQDLNRADSILKNNLKQVDSLRKTYIRVMVEESKKEFKGGTSIDLGTGRNNNLNNKEIELFNIDDRIRRELTEVSINKAAQFEIVNVIADFKSGYIINEISKNYIFIISVLFISIVVIFLLLKDLNSYLERYKNK